MSVAEAERIRQKYTDRIPVRILSSLDNVVFKVLDYLTVLRLVVVVAA